MTSRVAIVAACLLVGVVMFFSLNALQSSEPQLSGPGVVAATEEPNLAQSVERLSRQMRELKYENEELRKSKAEQRDLLRDLYDRIERIEERQEQPSRAESYFPQAPPAYRTPRDLPQPPAATQPYAAPVYDPMRPQPAQPSVPRHWQRLEINGQAFYIIPEGEAIATQRVKRLAPQLIRTLPDQPAILADEAYRQRSGQQEYIPIPNPVPTDPNASAPPTNPAPAKGDVGPKGVDVNADGDVIRERIIERRLRRAEARPAETERSNIPPAAHSFGRE